jgi:hypothetical protein
VSVQWTPTRARPPSPDQYFVDLVGSSNGTDLVGGPRSDYADTLPCMYPAVTTNYTEIACVMPEGYGGQLEWRVTVLGRTSSPYRYSSALWGTS